MSWQGSVAPRRHGRRRRPKASARPSQHEDVVVAPAFAEALCEIRQLLDSPELADQGRGIEAMRGQVWPLARHREGCYLVQAALERASLRELGDIVYELHGHVLQACSCYHANYVVQRAIQASPTTMTEFVSEELHGIAPVVARHRVGCRILVRLLEHGAAVASIVHELLLDGGSLSRHRYGHHVMVALCEHGSPDQKSEVTRLLCTDADACYLACHRYAGYVVEAAVRYSGIAADDLKRALLDDPGRLAQSPTGCYALVAMLSTSQGDVHTALARALTSQRYILRQSSAGRTVEEILY